MGFFFLSRLQKNKLISLWLAGTSIAFYALWNPIDLIPLFISVFINYLVYISITRFKQKQTILIIGVAFNILFLAYFKYLSAWFAEFLNLSSNLQALNIPLGISFYTFTQIAFLVDCYHKQYEKNDFLNYFLFVSYFPHLVCGPILSFNDLYPQLVNSDKFKASLSNFNIFLFCFSIGLFKKTVIGDYLGAYSTEIFDTNAGSVFSFKTALLGTLCYSMQLYFDFSGYSDMAWDYLICLA